MSDDKYGYICDVHYSLLKTEHEEFSTPILDREKCDFCDNDATHWLPRKLLNIHFIGNGELTVVELIDLLKKQDPTALVLINIQDFYYLVSKEVWVSEQKEGDEVVARAVILDAII